MYGKTHEMHGKAHGRTGGLGLLVLGATLALAATHAAHAGDDGKPGPAPAWHGWYVGAAAGYGLGTSDFTFAGGSVGPLTTTGVQGVLSIGRDFRLGPGWVAGMFADYTFGEITGPLEEFPSTLSNQFGIGGRLGVLLAPATLLYASGGYTAADFNASAAGLATIVDTTVDGYFVGLGVEQALSRNLALTLGYRFSDFGDVRDAGNIASFDNTLHSVRMGVNWRLGDLAAGASERSEALFAPPARTWTGLHVGASAGYAFGTSTTTIANDPLGPTSGEGAGGALTAGYDVQLGSRWVAGLLADYAFGEVEGGHPELPFTIDNQWAVGARLGVLLAPSTLLYGSAGYTAADSRQRLADGTPLIDTSVSGLFLGLGLEQAISRHLSLKLEYRHSDLKDRLTLTDGTETFPTSVDNTLHAVRLGVNWKLH